MKFHLNLNNKNFPTGTTIEEGIKRQASFAKERWTFKLNLKLNRVVRVIANKVESLFQMQNTDFYTMS